MDGDTRWLTIQCNHVAASLRSLLHLVDGFPQILQEHVDRGGREHLSMGNIVRARPAITRTCHTVMARCRAGGSLKAFRCHPFLPKRSPTA